MCDRKGIISTARTDLNESKKEILSMTNKNNLSGTLADAAMYYYETDLNSKIPDDVPTTDKDPAGHQHLVIGNL